MGPSTVPLDELVSCGDSICVQETRYPSHPRIEQADFAFGGSQGSIHQRARNMIQRLCPS